jgi:alanine racemase
MAEETMGVDWLAVFFLSEALLLRKHGIKKPILVLGHIDADPADAVGLKIDFIVDDCRTVDLLSRTAHRDNSSFNVHVKIDTGMSRFGVFPKDIENFITYLKKNRFIRITGLSTHLAESSDEDKAFTQQQLHIFHQVIMQMRAMKIAVPLIHATNTAGVMRFVTQDSPYTLFRVGLGLYGFFPTEYVKKEVQKAYQNFHLIPVLTWKSKIITIKKIEKGSYVGYSRMCQVARDTVYALVSVGYYDGYDLLLSHGTAVLVNGKKTIVLGRVAMNVVTIDVTDIPSVQVGDEVILCGSSGEDIKAHALAADRNLYVRSLLARIPAHIPRFTVP